MKKNSVCCPADFIIIVIIAISNSIIIKKYYYYYDNYYHYLPADFAAHQHLCVALHAQSECGGDAFG